jgi:DNA-binding transcriptional MerR regulator
MEQISGLRYFGFTLDEIRELLSATDAEILASPRAQRTVVQ